MTPSEIDTACTAVLRRVTVAALVEAAVRYTPQSYDDALQMRDRVLVRLEAEIVAAADENNDPVYRALRALRDAFVRDYGLRAPRLARLRYFVLRAPLPSLVLAQRLYKDPLREPELVRQCRPTHPAFMPTRLTALAT